MNGINASSDQILSSHFGVFHRDLQKADFNNTSAMYTKFQSIIKKIKTIFDLIVSIINNYDEIINDTPYPTPTGKEKYKVGDLSWVWHDSNLYRRAETHLFTFSQDYFICHGEQASKATKTLARQKFYNEEKERVKEVIAKMK